MQKIVPHLWFDKEAKDAVAFYTSIFPNSKITGTALLNNTPSNTADVITFDIWGYSMMALNAGPYFKANPSISFFLNFDPAQDKDASTHIEEMWVKLSEGGKVLMPFQKYPHSEKYGWIQDKFGISWQLMLTNPNGEPRPNIMPSIMFVGDVNGKAKEATDFYISIFKNSKRGTLALYPTGMVPGMDGGLMFTDFMLEGQWFAAMDGGTKHDFKFNEGISLIVNTADQKELDYYWEKLSAVNESEQCGWLKDKYGLSWQVQPEELNDMMTKGTQEQVDRLTQAILPMKKLDFEPLRNAFEGK